MNLEKPLLVMFIGIPGSGKTHFATRLAEKIDAVRLNSDAMRLSIFGSLETIEAMYNGDDRPKLNTYTFNAMEYATGQILSSGRSVVYEAIQRTSSDRHILEQLAAQHGARAVLVWIKTDHDVALQRGMAREATPEHRQFDEKTMREVIEHFSEQLDHPTDDEPLIEISGEIPFEQQYELFEQKLQELSHDQAS